MIFILGINLVWGAVWSVVIYQCVTPRHVPIQPLDFTACETLIHQNMRVNVRITRGINWFEDS